MSNIVLFYNIMCIANKSTVLHLLKNAVQYKPALHKILHIILHAAPIDLIVPFIF